MNDDKVVKDLKEEFEEWWRKWNKGEWLLKCAGIIGKEDAWELFSQAALSREKRLQELIEYGKALVKNYEPDSFTVVTIGGRIQEFAQGDSK